MGICGRQAGDQSQKLPKTFGQLRRVFHSRPQALQGVLLALWFSGQLHAQQAQQPSPITLQQAVNIALEKNPERKAAFADTKAASATCAKLVLFCFPT